MYSAKAPRSDGPSTARRALGLLTLAALVGSGCAAGAQDSERLVARGQALFIEQGCYGCHTVGKMGTPIAPDLTLIGQRHQEAELLRWLAGPGDEPRRHMPKISMSQDDARALAAYLASLR